MRHGHLRHFHVQASAAPHHAADGHLGLEASRLQKAWLGLGAAAQVLLLQADARATRSWRVDVRRATSVALLVSLHARARAHTHTLADAGSSSIERERRRTKESRD